MEALIHAVFGRRKIYQNALLKPTGQLSRKDEQKDI